MSTIKTYYRKRLTKSSIESVRTKIYWLAPVYEKQIIFMDVFRTLSNISDAAGREGFKKGFGFGRTICC